MFFRTTGDYKQCVAEHGELIKRYAADIIGHNQLAHCASQLRDFTRARDEMRAIVQILPMRTIFRANLSFYSSYIGDFATGEEQARKIAEIAPADTYGQLGLALSQMGQGQIPQAIETFTTLAKLDTEGKPAFTPRAATISASGLGDLAVYEGRYAEAVRILERGAAEDLAAKFGALAANKYAEEAYAQMLSGQKTAAVASAQKALDNSKVPKIRFVAARTFIEAGQAAKAAPLIKGLSAELQPEPQAYGKILEAEIAMMSKDPKPAIKLLTDANAILDTWIGHFELGRAYLLIDQPVQAYSEFDQCIKRRGEAISLFLDEEPTFGYYPMAYYYQGRVREAMKQSNATESYRAYLTAREKSGEDPLIADVKKRVK
jgi:tetratricopeptide (TPR) repeat protein